MPDPVLGIDLGTSNSVVASLVDGQPEVLRDAEGRALQPSVVAFHPSGSILVGHDARARLRMDPRFTIYSAKRLIGRPFADPTASDFLRKVPFQAVEGDNQEILVETRDDRMTIPELSAFVIHHLKVIAERSLRKMVRKAVITVPANFNDAQRAATLAAGETAGLEVLRILNEPTAAALSYGYGKNLDRRVIIYDFGGGTFDVTILDIRGDLFEVRATAGDTYLGGNDFDARLVERLAQQVLVEHRFDPREDDLALGKLRQAAEEAKCELSYQPKATVALEELAFGPGGKALSFRHVIERTAFEKLVEDLVDRTFVICDEAFHLAGLSANQVDEVVLVGGTTRIPLVRQSVQSYFARKPLATINPDEVVALGAVLQGAALLGLAARAPSAPRAPTPPLPAPGQPERPGPAGPPPPPPPRAVPPPVPTQAAGPPPARGPQPVSGDGGKALPWAPRAPLPAPTEGPVELELVSPAQDAPPEPPIPAETIRRPLLLDVTPLSLGVATVGGWSQVIIPRNSPVPVEASRTYVTSEDDQTLVSIRICQGESKRFEENTELGELRLEGLPAAPRGEVKIRVSFEIDSSGILEASAADERTGQSHKATIQLRGKSARSKKESRISGEEGSYRLARDQGAEDTP